MGRHYLLGGLLPLLSKTLLGHWLNLFIDCLWLLLNHKGRTEESQLQAWRYLLFGTLRVIGRYYLKISKLKHKIWDFVEVNLFCRVLHLEIGVQICLLPQFGKGLVLIILTFCDIWYAYITSFVSYVHIYVSPSETSCVSFLWSELESFLWLLLLAHRTIKYI